ncbi:bifunctional oligoribonuclease/PAP phosphatase NrnA [Calditrichota bacterium]
MKVSNTHKESANEILDFISQNDQFLLSAHVNADGDAIASVLAVSLLLEYLQKDYFIVFNDQEIDSRFNYLQNFDKITHYHDKLDLPIKSAIICDVPGLHRLGEVEKLLPDYSKIVKIDHHPMEDNFAVISMVDETASSTTHLVHEIIETLNMPVSVEMAKAIYTGIVYDTGRFSFSNTSARDMYICAKMIDAGVDPFEITDRIFFSSSFKALRTIGTGLAHMENYLDGEVIVIYLSHEEMKNNHQGEVEELANYSVAIRGGKVGLFIRESKPGFHKVSLRSKCDVDVNEVAKVFGGGGHTRAAGCRFEANKEEILEKILAEIEKRLRETLMT